MFESNNQKLIWWYCKREAGILTSFPQHTWIYCVCVWACRLSRFSHVQLFATLWAVAHQAPLSMGFSKQAYWSGLPCLPLGDLLYPGIDPKSLISPTLSDVFFYQKGHPRSLSILCVVFNCFFSLSYRHTYAQYILYKSYNKSGEMFWINE